MTSSRALPKTWSVAALIARVVVALLGAVSVQAQAATVSQIRLRGQTVDSVGRSVAGVMLVTSDGTRRAESDSLGFFTLDSLRSGAIGLVLAHPHFGTLTIAIPLSPGDTSLIPVFLFARADPAPQTVRPQMLYGFVTNARGMPVDSAELLVMSTGQTAKTDSLGRFTFADLRVADHFVRVRKMGYYVQYIPVRTQATSAVRAQVVLESMTTTLAEVLVRAERVHLRLRRFQERLEHNGFGVFLTRQQILERGAFSVTDLLGGMRADAMNSGCRMSVFLDGQPLTLDGVSLDAFVKLNDLFGVEIYRRGLDAPLELAYGPLSNLSCGVIGFWTR